MKTNHPVSLLFLCLAPTLVGAPAAAQGCTLLGSDASGGNLVGLSPVSGAGVVLGNTNIGSMPSLATDPTTGILYAGQGQGSPFLFTIDPSSGFATLVGNTMLGFAALSGLAFDQNGILYASANILNNGASGGDTLVTVDKTTGVATIIGTFGTCPVLPGTCSIEGIEGIAFGPGGVLYGVLSQRGSIFSGAPAGLYTIDTATGAATFVSTLSHAGTGAPASGGFVGLEYCHCNRVLYGGTATALGAATDGGFLAAIDVETGEFEYVGGTSATGGSSLAAVALGFRASTVQCDPEVLDYGCINPAGSLVTLSGAPVIGSTYQVGVDDPIGAAEAGSGAIVLIATKPDAAFPCGTQLLGYGMSQPFGELLVSASPPNPFVGLISPALWMTPGSPVPIDIPIPFDVTLSGARLYIQGVLIAQFNQKLTAAVRITIGS